MWRLVAGYQTMEADSEVWEYAQSLSGALLAHVKTPLCSPPSLRLLTALGSRLGPGTHTALSFFFGPGCLGTGWITALEFCQSHKMRKDKKHTQQRAGLGNDRKFNIMWFCGSGCSSVSISSSRVDFGNAWAFPLGSCVHSCLVDLSGHFLKLQNTEFSRQSLHPFWVGELFKGPIVQREFSWNPDKSQVNVWWKWTPSWVQEKTTRFWVLLSATYAGSEFEYRARVGTHQDWRDNGVRDKSGNWGQIASVRTGAWWLPAGDVRQFTGYFCSQIILSKLPNPFSFIHSTITFQHAT